jgi:hypothetical protein
MAIPVNALALLPRAGVDMARADPQLRAMGERLSADLGYDLPVISAYRSPQKNDSVDGARKSQHLHGKAMDIDVSGLSIAERQRLIARAREMGFGGVGIYKDSLHLDTGPVRAWGPSRRSDSVPGWARSALAGGGERVAQAAEPAAPATNDGPRRSYFDERVEAQGLGTLFPEDKPAAVGKTAAPAGAAPAKQGYFGGMVDAVTQGVTLGFGDELTALENALLGGTKDESFWQEYDRFLRAERTQQDQFAAENPVSAIGGQVAGAIAPALIAGPVAAATAVGKAARGVVAATPAGMAARVLPGGATPLSQAGRAAGAGAVAGGIEGVGAGEGMAGRAVGGLVGAATGTVGGVVGQQAFKGIGRIAGALLGNPAMHRNGTLTDLGRETLRRNGIDPDAVSDEFTTLYAQRLREGNAGNPDEAARMAVTDEFGIAPVTRGQATGNLDQLAFEDAARNVGRGRQAAETMRGIEATQRESVDRAAKRMGAAMGDDAAETYIDAAGNVGAFVKGDAEAMREAYQEAYAKARGMGLTIPLEAFEPLAVLYKQMPVDNVFLAGGKGRQAIEAVGDYLNNVIAKAPDGATAIDFEAVEKLRRRLNQVYGAAEKGDRYEVAQVIRGMDDWLDEVFARTLAYGPEDGFKAMKEARGKFRAYKEKWGGERGQSLTAKASRVVEQMAEDDMSPVDVARAIYGAGMTGEKALGRAIAQRLKTRLPDEVWGSVKAGMLYHALTGGQATQARGYRFMANRLAKLVDGEGGPISRVVFSQAEQAQIRRFVKALRVLDTPDSARNPSKTSYGIARLMSDSFPALAGMLGMQAGGVGGAVAAAGGAAARKGIGNWLATRGIVAGRATKKPVGPAAVIGGASAAGFAPDMLLE